MTTRTPSVRSASRVATVAEVALISAVSVISRMSRDGSSPAHASASSTAPTKPGLLDLAGRHVDAHEQARRRDAGLLPRHRALAGLAHDPAADRQDRAVLLGDLDELAGRDQPAIGMLPAHERLEPGDAPGLERDDRLVDEPQLAEVDRVLELGSELVAGADRRRACPGRRRRSPALPLALAMYIATSALRTISARSPTGVAGAGDADAGGDRDGVLADDVRHAQVAHQPLGHRPRSAEVRLVIGQDGELVAAEPRDEVALAHEAADPLGHGDQQRVAGRVAERVVDRP